MTITYEPMTRQEMRIFLDAHFCGCGNPENAAGSLLRLLEQFEDGPGFEESGEPRKEPAYLALPRWLPDDGVVMLLLYWLSHLELTEHGGGVLGSWLTGTGQRLLEGLRREEADDFEGLFAVHCVHGFDVHGFDAEGPGRHACASVDPKGGQTGAIARDPKHGDLLSRLAGLGRDMRDHGSSGTSAMIDAETEVTLTLHHVVPRKPEGTS